MVLKQEQDAVMPLYGSLDTLGSVCLAGVGTAARYAFGVQLQYSTARRRQETAYCILEAELQRPKGQLGSTITNLPDEYTTQRERDSKKTPRYQLRSG